MESHACYTVTRGDHCAPYCNDYTCADSNGGHNMCGGCSFCTDHAIANRCQSWCSMYTCGQHDCLGCEICKPEKVHAWCADWCNDWTCSSKHCNGCTVCNPGPYVAPTTP